MNDTKQETVKKEDDFYNRNILVKISSKDGIDEKINQTRWYPTETVKEELIRDGVLNVSNDISFYRLTDARLWLRALHVEARTIRGKKTRKKYLDYRLNKIVGEIKKLGKTYLSIDFGPTKNDLDESDNTERWELEDLLTRLCSRFGVLRTDINTK